MGGHRIYVCSFSNLCNCPVLFCIVKHGCVTRLQIEGKHDANSHDVDQSSRLNLQQRAAVQSVARAHSTSSATQVRCNLGLQEKVVYVSPSKHLQVLRVVKQVRETVFDNFTSGQHVDNPEGSLTLLSTSIFFKTLVAEYNRGGKHLSLHNPICFGYQYSKIFFWFLFLIFHAPKCCAQNCCWLGVENGF